MLLQEHIAENVNLDNFENYSTGPIEGEASMEPVQKKKPSQTLESSTVGDLPLRKMGRDLKTASYSSLAEDWLANVFLQIERRLFYCESVLTWICYFSQSISKKHVGRFLASSDSWLRTNPVYGQCLSHRHLRIPSAEHGIEIHEV
jgi:hypothetical protein